MSERRASQRVGLLGGAAAAQATVLVAASAVRHVGWWLSWQTRSWPSAACRELDLAGGVDEARRD